MEEYNILFKYGIEVGILGAFLWAFKRVLSAVINDKARNMEIIVQNTEAFYDLKGTMKGMEVSLQDFSDKAISAITGVEQRFADKHEALLLRDREVIELLKEIKDCKKGDGK